MHRRSPQNPLFINTILLGGTPTEKIVAARVAGFDQIELWRQDVEAYDGSAEKLGQWLKEENVGLTDYQVLLDFGGAPELIRGSKRAETLIMLDTAMKVGARTVLTPACTNRDCVAERIDDDMRWLARQAVSRGLRIAMKAWLGAR